MALLEIVGLRRETVEIHANPRFQALHHSPLDVSRQVWWTSARIPL
jgi:hypothetical protein